VDFQARSDEWTLPLDFPGTQKDLERGRVELRAGMKLNLYTLDATEDRAQDDLVAVGTVIRTPAGDWLVRINPDELVHVSDLDAVDQALYEAARLR